MTRVFFHYNSLSLFSTFVNLTCEGVEQERYLGYVQRNEITSIPSDLEEAKKLTIIAVVQKAFRSKIETNIC